MPYPTWSIVAGTAAYWDYRHNLREELYDPRAHLAVGYNHTVVPGTTTFNVTLPDADVVQQYNTLKAYLQLDCRFQGETQPASWPQCGEWDYLAYLDVYNDGQFIEAVRYVTSYGRGGAWMTDITPQLLYLAQGGNWTLRLRKSYTYVTTVFLHLSKKPSYSKPPVKSVDLFTGGWLGPNFASEHPPITLTVNTTMHRVVLYAVISGHGWGQNLLDCAEFCNTEHAFTVNNHTFSLQFELAGTDDGCAKRTADGVTPNQYGTWFYGRAGVPPSVLSTPASQPTL